MSELTGPQSAPTAIIAASQGGFGVRDSGDTSGFGGLVRTVSAPPALAVTFPPNRLVPAREIAPAAVKVGAPDTTNEPAADWVIAPALEVMLRMLALRLAST